MESCALSGDYGTLETVCRHLASHHRNDEDVLRTWEDSVMALLKPARPVTPATWQLLHELADLRTAQLAYPCAGIDVRTAHARALLRRDQDASALLRWLVQHHCNLSLRYLPADIKPAILKAMREEAESEGKSAKSIVIKLLEGKEPNLLDVVLKIAASEDDPDQLEDLILAAITSLGANPRFRAFLESIFLRLTLTIRLVDAFWRYHPNIIVAHAAPVVTALIGNVSPYAWPITDSFFHADIRRLCFFGIMPVIKQTALDSWETSNFDARKNIVTLLARTCSGTEFVRVSQQLLAEGKVEREHKTLVWKMTRQGLAEVLELKGMEPRIAAKKVASLSAHAPQDMVLDACKALVLDYGACVAFIVSGMMSAQDGAKFLSQHEMTSPDARLAVLRARWKWFLGDPCAAGWAAVEEASAHCHALTVRRVLRVQATPPDYVPNLARLVWNRLAEDIDKWKRWFIQSIPDQSIALLPADVRLSLLAFHGTECKFFYSCWVINPSDKDVERLALSRLKVNAFAEQFVALLAEEAVKAGDGALIGVALNNLMAQVRPELLYRLQLLQLYLASPDNFAVAVAGFVRDLTDAELSWRLVRLALAAAVVDAKMALMTLLPGLQRAVSTRAGRVLVTSMLPEAVPREGRYVRDGDAAAYKSVVRGLRDARDPAVNVYLHVHHNHCANTDSAWPISTALKDL